MNFDRYEFIKIPPFFPVLCVHRVESRDGDLCDIYLKVRFIAVQLWYIYINISGERGGEGEYLNSKGNF